MTPWQVLIGTLSTRSAPPAKSSAHDDSHKRHYQKRAEVESTILKIVAQMKIACADEVRKKLNGVSVDRTRTLMTDLQADGLLRVSMVGNANRKYWSINE